jgi:hypothetical protein
MSASFPIRIAMRMTVATLAMLSIPVASATQFAPLRCGIVGGGDAYPVPIDVASEHATVRTYTELLAALDARDRVIHIPSGITIDVPNSANALIVPDGTTLYGERGSPVPHLRVAASGTGDNNYPIISAGSHVTFFGLRIEGPSTVIDTNQLTIGIQQQPGAHGLRVQNNELWGWPGSAISIKSAHGAVIVANDIHDNRRAERGYGVVVQNGNASAAIHCNVFRRNRHAIAGSGLAGESYQAMANLVLPEGNGHAFDMHRAPGEGPGGKAVTVIGNWFAFGGTPWAPPRSQATGSARLASMSMQASARSARSRAWRAPCLRMPRSLATIASGSHFRSASRAPTASSHGPAAKPR